VGILARIRSWFTRSGSGEPPLERAHDLPYLPAAPESCRPQAGTMAVAPLRCSEHAGFGY
jgi:hypothetical protein